MTASIHVKLITFVNVFLALKENKHKAGVKFKMCQTSSVIMDILVFWPQVLHEYQVYVHMPWNSC